MTATAIDELKTGSWKLWLPGVVTPVACFLADYAAGELVLQFAPAALLCLAGIGIGALVLSRAQPQGVGGLIAVGPMWIVSGSALALGIPLAAISVWIWPLGSWFLLLALLGLTPLWTGVTYTRAAYVLTKRQLASHGALKIGLAAIVGCLTATSIVIGAQAIDSRFVATRLAALDTRNPKAWQAALPSLTAYPLCGRRRCRRLVCKQLVRLFPPPDSALLIPVPIDGAFKQAFGVSANVACMSPF